MAEPVPALPPGFKLDPIPDLPPGFKLDPVDTPKAGPAPKDDRAPFGVPSSKPHKGFIETVGPESTVGKMASKVDTFLSNYVDPFLPSGDDVIGMAIPEGKIAKGVSAFARRALATGAALGTGYVVDSTAQKIGMPPWLAETLGGVAGVAVGGRLGLSPETMETLKSGGVAGFVRKVLKGKSSADTAADFFKIAYGRAP